MNFKPIGDGVWIDICPLIRKEQGSLVLFSLIWAEYESREIWGKYESWMSYFKGKINKSNAFQTAKHEEAAERAKEVSIQW